MSSPELKESASQRIQSLRQQLEQYNATIAAAMGFVSAGKASGSNSTTAAVTPSASADPAPLKGVRVSPPPPTASAVGPSPLFSRASPLAAPRLSRDLSSDFSATAVEVSQGLSLCEPRAQEPLQRSPKSARTPCAAVDGVDAETSQGGSEGEFEVDGEEYEEDCDESTESDTSSATEEALQSYLKDLVARDPSLREWARSAAAGEATDDRTQSARLKVQQAARRFREQWAIVRQRFMQEQDPGEEGTSETTSVRDDYGYQSSESMDAQADYADPSLMDPGVTFSMMDRGYHQLQAVRLAAEHVRTWGLHVFPAALPEKDRLTTVVDRFNKLVTETAVLRRAAETPSTAGHSSLESLRTEHGQAVQSSAEDLLKDAHTVLESFNGVRDRRRQVERKRRLLEQRRMDLRERREARSTVEKECERLRDRTGAHQAELKERELRYTTRLKDHATQESDIQQRVEGIEELNQKISTWLKILEERDAALTAKEDRLQRVKTDLLRRSADLHTFRNASKRAKYPPLPSPRVEQE